MTVPRFRLAVVILVLATALIRDYSAARSVFGPAPRRLDFREYSTSGEIIANGIRSRADVVSVRMPLASVVLARLAYHTAAPYGRLLVGNLTLTVLLVFALGLLLHPWGALIAGAAVAVTAGAAPYLQADSGYTLLILLTAGLLVWRARAPSPRRSAWLAAAVGAGLMWRSPLAFFTPALAVYEWSTEHRFSFKTYKKQFLILCLVPYLFLLPWIVMNWAIHRRLVIFERGAASSNIATGALGLVGDIEGDLDAVVDEPIDTTDEGAVVGWAVRQVARHPLRYARACARRVAYALSEKPLVALFAVAGFWAFRRRREYRELAFLAAYYLGIHCLMTVEPRYFWPLWPLLGILACSWPAVCFGRERPAEDSPEVRTASWFLKVALTAVLVLCLGTDWKVLSFARLMCQKWKGAEAEYDEALRSNPDDVWLLEERGEVLLRQGDPAGAARDFSHAAVLDPTNSSLTLSLAEAEAQMGRYESLLAWRDVDPGSSLAIKAEILRSSASVRRGRRSEAIGHLKAAKKELFSRDVLVRGPQDELGDQVLDRLRASESGFFRYVRDVLGPRPNSEKLALDELLVEIDPKNDGARIEMAALAAEAGKSGAAREQLAKAQKSGLDTEAKQRSRLRVYRELKDYDRASALLEELSRRHPDEAGLLIERAELAAEKGERGKALALLAQADRRRLLDETQDPELRRRVALVYMNLKVDDRALDIFSRLARQYPGDASFRSDLGQCEYASGAVDAALADLRAALALDARFLPASLSLGAVLEARGRFREAVEVYDAAIAGTAPGGADSLREAVISARRDALARIPR